MVFESLFYLVDLDRDFNLQIQNKSSIFSRLKLLLESDKKVITSLVIVIISVSFLFNISQLVDPILFYDNGYTIDPFLDNCSIEKLPPMRDTLRYYTLCLSDKVFDNVRVIPVFSTMSLALCVFLYARVITRSNSLSLISLLVFVSTNTFHFYGFTATYDQTWVLLLFTSLLLLNTRFRYYSLIPYIFSMFFRGLPLLDFPIILTQISLLDIPGRQKRKILILYSLIVLLASLYTLSGGYAIINGAGLNFDLKNSLSGMLFNFRFDMILFSSLPVVIFFLNRIHTKESGFILFGITYLFFQIFYLNSFTNLGQEPYRLMPLIAFLVIGFSLILKDHSNIKNDLLHFLRS